VRWLTIDEAAIAAGVSTRTIRRWINTGLRCAGTGEATVVDPVMLEQWRAIRAMRKLLP
jgi:hypothetical protein